MGNFARPLADAANVENFLIHCLGIATQCDWLEMQNVDFDELVQKIREAEAANLVIGREPTLTSHNNRHRKHRDEDARQLLRRSVLTDLITLERLDDDDEIELGRGGAMPRGKSPVAQRNAYFIVGLPASGKSTLVSKTADELGAVIVDSDFAKRKLPEFDGTLAGANLVHKESSHIVFGGGGAESLLGYCTTNGLNIVIPTVGANVGDVLAEAQALKSAGYKVHLSATILCRDEAAKRATSRFLKTKRYVPLGLIFDGYANDPLMHYYQQRCQHASNPFWASIGSYHTGGHTPGAVEFTDKSNPVSLLEGDAK